MVRFLSILLAYMDFISKNLLLHSIWSDLVRMDFRKKFLISDRAISECPSAMRQLFLAPIG